MLTKLGHMVNNSSRGLKGKAMTDFEQALAWFNKHTPPHHVRSFSDDHKVLCGGTRAECEAFVVARGESLEVLRRFEYIGLDPINHPREGDVQGDLYIEKPSPPMKCTCGCGGCGGVADAADSCWCWACRCNGCVTTEQMREEEVEAQRRARADAALQEENARFWEEQREESRKVDQEMILEELGLELV